MKRFLFVVVALIPACESHLAAKHATAPRRIAAVVDPAEAAKARRRAMAIDLAECQALSCESSAAREELAARVKALKMIVAPDEPLRGPEALIGRYEALTPIDGSCFFECGAKYRLTHLCDPNAGKAMPAIVADASHWLADQGIDLIFVPVPCMTEVYPERFLTKVPPDGVAFPHVFQRDEDLLRADVEVLDPWKALRDQRHQESLYCPDDTHWSPQGMRVVARLIGARMARFGYPVAGPANFILDEGSQAYFVGNGCRCLTEGQVKMAESVHIDRPTIRAAQGCYLRDAKSPVLVTGDSYCRYFEDYLAMELNCPTRSGWMGGAVTHQFAEFVRDPQLLEGVRVVVWCVARNHAMEIAKLPPQVK
jgi:hypothetical protein